MNRLSVFFQQSSMVDITGKTYAHGYTIVLQDENSEYLYPVDTSEELLEFNTPEKVFELITNHDSMCRLFMDVIRSADGFYFAPGKKWYSISCSLAIA